QRKRILEGQSAIWREIVVTQAIVVFVTSELGLPDVSVQIDKKCSGIDLPSPGPHVAKEAVGPWRHDYGQDLGVVAKIIYVQGLTQGDSNICITPDKPVRRGVRESRLL